MMLATWLVEIYLSKINQLEDFAAAERSTDDAENFRVEKGILEDDMRQFLTTYKVRFTCSCASSRVLILMVSAGEP